MENLDQSYGFVTYETHISGPREAAPLTIREVRDRAHVFVDGTLVGILEREFPAEPLRIAIPAGGADLTILVENMGRINYGDRLADRKGISDCVMLGQQILHGWTITPLPLDDLSRLTFETGTPSSYPAFHRGYVHVTSPEDTFFSPQGWSKGVCWVNGFNIGRYWKRGPQQTLYVPQPLLKEGRNEVILLELDGTAQNTVEFCARPTLNQPRHQA